jgi:enterochelin esterase-like enzyme
MADGWKAFMREDAGNAEAVSRRGFLEASGLLPLAALLGACSFEGASDSAGAQEDAGSDGIGIESGDDSAFDANGFAERSIDESELATHPVQAPIEAVPESYFEDSSEPGTIEAFGYETQTYAEDGTGDGRTFAKTCNVYLPYGYSGSGDRVYDILYLQHGAGGDESSWLGEPGTAGSDAKRILDHLMADGLIRPMIVVTPSIPEGDDRWASEFTSYLSELGRDLMPAVERHYRTFAATADSAGFAASRERRYFGGFSMGAYETWYVLIHYLPWFKYYLPLCGNMRYESTDDECIAQADSVADAAVASGMPKEDYLVFAADGTADITYENMSVMVDRLKERTDAFSTSDDGFVDADGTLAANLVYLVVDGYEHSQTSAQEYLYDGMRQLDAPQG